MLANPRQQDMATGACSPARPYSSADDSLLTLHDLVRRLSTQVDKLERKRESLKSPDEYTIDPWYPTVSEDYAQLVQQLNQQNITVSPAKGVPFDGSASYNHWCTLMRTLPLLDPAAQKIVKTVGLSAMQDYLKTPTKLRSSMSYFHPQQHHTPPQPPKPQPREQHSRAQTHQPRQSCQDHAQCQEPQQQAEAWPVSPSKTNGLDFSTDRYRQELLHLQSQQWSAQLSQYSQEWNRQDDQAFPHERKPKKWLRRNKADNTSQRFSKVASWFLRE